MKTCLCSRNVSKQDGRCAVDYIEFRKTMNEKYAKVEERQEHRLRRRRRWLYASLILFALTVLELTAALIAFRLRG